jgi:glucokinase
MEHIIGVDIGGTQTRAALVDCTGDIISQMHALTDVHRGSEAVIEKIIEYIDLLQGMIPANGTLKGVGIGCPGPLDPHKGIVFTAPNLPGWSNVPIRDIVAERTGLKVRLANDANAAALGEWLFGGGKGCQHLVYITVSTGIGSGIIVDGHPLLGHQGAGGELGHMLIDVREQKSWEQLASGTALKLAARDMMKTHAHTSLHQMATPETITAADVARAALQGDLVAQRLMHREAHLLGLGFVNVLHLFSPEIILVGGSVVTSNPSLLEHARSVVQELVISDVYRSVPIEVVHLGNNVGVLGAAALMLEEE